jgi:hypothetical protein
MWERNRTRIDDRACRHALADEHHHVHVTLVSEDCDGSFVRRALNVMPVCELPTDLVRCGFDFGIEFDR